MRVATANIRNLPDMPRPWVVADAAAAGAVADVVGFQEIGEAEDHQDVLAGLGAGWSLHAGGLDPAQCDGPIGYRTDLWEPTGKGGHLLLHTGVAKISATRRLVWVELRRIDRPHVVVRFGNAHFVANVWGPGDDARTDHEIRVRTWQQDYSRADLFVTQCVDAGVPVVMTLDANMGGRFRAFAGGTIAYGPGIEKITLHPAGGVGFDVRGVGTVRGGVHSDHPVRWARVGITAPPPPPVPHPCPLEGCGFLHLPPAEEPTP